MARRGTALSSEINLSPADSEFHTGYEITLSNYLEDAGFIVEIVSLPFCILKNTLRFELWLKSFLG